MIEQIANSQAGVAGKKGKAQKAGLFAKFLAAFQKQIQKGAGDQFSATHSSFHGTKLGKTNFVEGLASKMVTKPGGAEELVFNKTQSGISKGVKTVIPLQATQRKITESGEMVKEAFFASLNGNNNISISKASADEESDVVAGLGVAKPEQANLFAKRGESGESNGSGEKSQGRKNSFAANQQRIADTQVVIPKEGETAAGVKGAVEGEVKRGSSIVSTTLSSGTATTRVDGEIRGAYQAPGSFEGALRDGVQREAQASADKGALAAKADVALRSSNSSSVKGESVADLSDRTQIKSESGIAKEAKAAQQTVGNSQAAMTREGALDDAPRAGEQRVQNLAQRAQAQDTASKSSSDLMGKQIDKSDVPVNPLIQNNKARSASPANQPQVAVVTGSERMAANSGERSMGGFQQDSSTPQQQPDALLGDSTKADAKAARGSDFAMQMSQKAAHAYKPAEAMLEIARSAKDGSMKLELQLEPAHLGKVQVTLQTDAAKQLQVHINVDQSASRQLIEQHLPQLRAALAEQGLDLGHFSMGTNSQGQNDGSTEGGRAPFSEFANLNGVEGEDLDTSSVRLGINSASDGRISILA